MPRWTIVLTLLAALTSCRGSDAPSVRDEKAIELWEGLVDDAEGGDVEAVGQVLAGLSNVAKEPSPALRAARVAAAPRFQARDLNLVRRVLYATLKSDGHEIVRFEASVALLRARGPEATAGYVEALMDRDKNTGVLREDSAAVRVIAARGLGEIGRIEGAPALQATLSDPVRWVRCQAERSLELIAGGRKGRSPEEWARWINKQLR